jgi:hypothetical protein
MPRPGLDPKIMGVGPIYASARRWRRPGWKVEDLDLVEANEAFAAQACAVNKDMGWDPSIVNVNGGAIAIGHPIGRSGARVLNTLPVRDEAPERQEGASPRSASAAAWASRSASSALSAEAEAIRAPPPREGAAVPALKANGGVLDVGESPLSPEASRGIGAAISQGALMDEGYRVAASYAGNDAAAQAFTQETGIRTFKWNVADYEACKAGIAQVESELGPGRGAGEQRGHHAGRALPPHDAAAVARGHRHQPHRPLQHDPCRLGRDARPQVRAGDLHFLDQRAEGPVRQANYAAAKAGDIGFTKALAQEGARAGSPST